jgi:hypothetical protein
MPESSGEHLDRRFPSPLPPRPRRFGRRKSRLPLHANDFPFHGNAQVPVIRNTDSCTGAGTSTAINHSAG